jgi:hypothetical protein
MFPPPFDGGGLGWGQWGHPPPPFMLISATPTHVSAAGQVLCGTDVDCMEQYDPTDEYIYMSRPLRPMQILASLTIGPAARWKESAGRGRIARRMQADLLVLKR